MSETARERILRTHKAELDAWWAEQVRQHEDEKARGVMSLVQFLDEVKDGDEHGWEREVGYLIVSNQQRERTRALADDIRRNGIREPIHIGSDGRCWDGHHRVAVALMLGLDEVPVRDDRQGDA